MNLVEILANGGMAGAVIVVVILFLRSIKCQHDCWSKERSAEREDRRTERASFIKSIDDNQVRSAEAHERMTTAMTDMRMTMQEFTVLVRGLNGRLTGGPK